MKTLSNLNEGRKNCFTYCGKDIPNEFKVINLDEYKDYILNRNEEPFRYSEKFEDEFLNGIYGGNLPTNLFDLAHELKKPNYICDLYNKKITEEEYKETYSKEYANFFETKDYGEQKRIFYAADYGARNIYEFEQDVKAANISEDMVAYHTGGILSPNENASDRGENENISTSCDFIFKNPYREGMPIIEQPIELKTKWGKYLKNNEVVQMRGTINTLKKEGGMILAVYIRLNKAILIDPMSPPYYVNGQHYHMTPGKMGGKPCVNIEVVDKNDIVDFVFWDKDSVKKMMHMIYDKHQARTPKVD